jgi:RNA polymerase sigma-70 factor (ECF subfamily)
MGPSDEKLMGRYAAGDLLAFRELYSRYEKRIYNFFLRRLGDPERAADLFQEAFLRLHRNRGRYDSRRSFAAWFYTIANNLVRDEMRMRRGIHFEAIEEEDSLPASSFAAPEESRAMTEIREKVESALKMLPETQKEVLLLSRFEGLSHREIAGITGRSNVAVRQLLYRALQNLRRQLSDV